LRDLSTAVFKSGTSSAARAGADRDAPAVASAMKITQFLNIFGSGEDRSRTPDFRLQVDDILHHGFVKRPGIGHRELAAGQYIGFEEKKT
jgi:hypothetical protein